MFKRGHYELVGKVIQSLPDASTKHQIIMAFCEALRIDRSEFDAVKFKAVCGYNVAPEAAPEFIPSDTLKAPRTDTPTKYINEPVDMPQGDCIFCDELQCCDGAHGWSDAEIRERVARFYPKPVA